MVTVWLQSAFCRFYRVTERTRKEVLRTIGWKCYLKRGSINARIICFLFQCPDKKAGTKQIAEGLKIDERRLRPLLSKLKQRGLLTIDHHDDGREGIYYLTREGMWMYLAFELEIPFIALAVLAVCYHWHKRFSSLPVIPPYWYPNFINLRMNYKYYLYSAEYLRKTATYLVGRGYITRTDKDHAVSMTESAARYLSRFDRELSELYEWTNSLDEYIDKSFCNDHVVQEARLKRLERRMEAWKKQ